MAMHRPRFLRTLGRLFTIKTRWEAWLVIWAITLGAVERGKHYLEVYPGTLGWVFFTLCTGVVFVAGAKLLDSVRPQAAAKPVLAPATVRRLNRSRPKSSRRPAGSASRRWSHKS